MPVGNPSDASMQFAGEKKQGEVYDELLRTHCTALLLLLLLLMLMLVSTDKTSTTTVQYRMLTRSLFVPASREWPVNRKYRHIVSVPRLRRACAVVQCRLQIGRADDSFFCTTCRSVGPARARLAWSHKAGARCRGFCARMRSQKAAGRRRAPVRDFLFWLRTRRSKRIRSVVGCRQLASFTRDRRAINQPCRLCHDTVALFPPFYFCNYISPIDTGLQSQRLASIAINRARSDETKRTQWARRLGAIHRSQIIEHRPCTRWQK